MTKSSFKYQSENYTYYKIGRGKKKVLVLHGWGSNIESWREFFDETNKDEFTFYFPEMPGFGDSSNPPEPWKVDDYVDFCKAFNEEAANAEYLLVHSFGGRIAIKWLSEEKGAFEKAVFVGAAGIREKLPWYKKLIRLIVKPLKLLNKIDLISPLYKLARKYVYKFLRSSDYLQAEGTLKETFVNVINEDLTDQLHKIKIPVKLVWGEGDTYTPIWMAKTMDKKIKKSDLLVLTGARHGIHMQKPEKLARISQEFFS